jgi:hypothetical protein
MVRMGSAVRFRRGAPPQSGRSGRVQHPACRMCSGGGIGGWQQLGSKPCLASRCRLLRMPVCSFSASYAVKTAGRAVPTRPASLRLRVLLEPPGDRLAAVGRHDVALRDRRVGGRRTDHGPDPAFGAPLPRACGRAERHAGRLLYDAIRRPPFGASAAPCGVAGGDDRTSPVSNTIAVVVSLISASGSTSRCPIRRERA